MPKNCDKLPKIGVQVSGWIKPAFCCTKLQIFNVQHYNLGHYAGQPSVMSLVGNKDFRRFFFDPVSLCSDNTGVMLAAWERANEGEEMLQY